MEADRQLEEPEDHNVSVPQAFKFPLMSFQLSGAARIGKPSTPVGRTWNEATG